MGQDDWIRSLVAEPEEEQGDDKWIRSLVAKPVEQPKEEPTFDEKARHVMGRGMAGVGEMGAGIMEGVGIGLEEHRRQTVDKYTVSNDSMVRRYEQAIIKASQTDDPDGELELVHKQFGPLLEKTKAQADLLNKLYVVDQMYPGAGVMQAHSEKYAKAVRDFTNEILPADERLKDSFWLTTVPSGAGSAAAFFGGGAAGMAAKLPAWMTTMSMGMAAQGAAGYYRALESFKDADSEEAQQAAIHAWALNSMVGAGEIVPIAGMLNRWNKASGGGVTRAITTMAKEMLEEGTQEGGAQLLSNIAHEWATKEDVDLMAGVLENVAAGVAVGGLFSLGVSGATGLQQRGGKDPEPPAGDTVSRLLGLEEEAEAAPEEGKIGPTPLTPAEEAPIEQPLIAPETPPEGAVEAPAAPAAVTAPEPEKAPEPPVEAAEKAPVVEVETEAAQPVAPQEVREAEPKPPVGPDTDEIVEMSAFPGSILPDVKAGIEALRQKFSQQQSAPAFEGSEVTRAGRYSLTRAIHDSLRPVMKVQKVVKPEQESSDFYLQQELQKGRANSRLKTFQKETLQPLLKDARKAGLKAEGTKRPGDPGLAIALIARNAKDRNKLIRQRQANMLDVNEAGSGMEDAEADAIMSEIENGPHAESYARFFAQFDKITKATREAWVDAQLESREFVDQLEAQEPNYAPHKTLFDYEYLGIGRGSDIRGKETKAALGRRSLPDNPLAFAVFQHQQAVMRAEKNKASIALGAWLNENGGAIDGFAKHVKGVSKKEKLVGGLVKEVPDPSLMNDPSVVAYKSADEDGSVSTKFIQFEDIRLAKALRNESAQGLRAITEVLVELDKGMAKFNPGKLAAKLGAQVTSGEGIRRIAKFSTIWNIAFPPANAVKDLGTGVIVSIEHGNKFAASMVKDVPAAYGALMRPGKTKWADWLKRYDEAGAPMAFLDLNNTQDIIKQINRDLKQAGTGSIAKTRRGWTNLVRGVEELAYWSENATRLSAFKNAITQLGMTDAEAASYAKNLTVNFEKRGDLSNYINVLYMFAQAGINGIYRASQTLVTSPNSRRLLLSGMAGMMIWDQICRIIMGKDDDGEDRWDKIPEHEKDRNLIIPFDAVTGDVGDRIKVPLPFTFNALFSTARNVSSALSGDIDRGKALGNIGSSWAGAINPIGGTTILSAATPTVADPIVEIATNRDWANRTIMPNQNPYGGKTPDAYRFWPDVNPIAKAVSKTLNELTGGTKFKSGVIDVSPESIEHWTEFAFGGAGQMVNRLWNIGRKNISSEPIKAHEVPLLRRFFATESPYRSSKPFAEAMDALDIRVKEAKDAKESYGRENALLKQARKIKRDVWDSTEGIHEKPVAEQDKLLQQAERKRQQWLKRYYSTMGIKT